MPNSRLIVLPDGRKIAVGKNALRAGRRGTLQDPLQERRVDEDGRVLAFCECCNEFVPYWPLGSKRLSLEGVDDIRLTRPTS